MSTGKKALFKYIHSNLEDGHSFEQIKTALIKKGYPQKVAHGIILSYKHRHNILKWFVVSALALLFIFSFWLTGSGIAGMATLQYAKSYTDNLDLIINQSSQYSWYPSYRGEIISIAITGNLVGKGSSKVYIENKGKHLIFDSELENFKVTSLKSSLLGENIKHFDMVCEQTCSMKRFNKSIYNLEFIVEDAVLELEKIHFDVMLDREVEILPEFIDIPAQKASPGTPIRIDLSTFFNAS
jgi:hypothetical protein